MRGARTVVDHVGLTVLDPTPDGRGIQKIDGLPGRPGNFDWRVSARPIPSDDGGAGVQITRERFDEMTSDEAGGAGDQNDGGHPGGLCSQRGTPLSAPLKGEKFPSPASVKDMKKRRSTGTANVEDSPLRL